MEKAITLRRLLLTGKREPNIAATEAQKLIDESVAVLDREINDTLFEKRVRKALASETSTAILRVEKRRGSGIGPTLERVPEDTASAQSSSLQTKP